MKVISLVIESGHSLLDFIQPSLYPTECPDYPFESSNTISSFTVNFQKPSASYSNQDST